MAIVKKYHLFLFLTIIGGITCGYNISAIASALPKIKSTFHISESLFSLIAGLVFAGMAIAKLTMSLFNDILGRRKTLIISAIIFSCGTFIIIIAQAISYIAIGRLLQGFGGGLLMFTISLYIVELAHDQNRGKLTALYQLNFTIGLLIANIVGMFMYDINWRITFAVLLVLGIIFIITIYYLPCSPRWLFKSGDYAEAFNTLLITHTKAESQQIINNWKEDSIIPQSANVFQSKYLYALVLVVAVTCLNQLTGINAILQVSTILISEAGLAKQAALLGSIGITAINVLGTLIGITIVDRLPRNKLLGFCAIVIGLSHLIIALNFYSTLNSPMVLICGLFLFILSYAIGPGIIIWLVFSEYLPLPVRSQGIAVAGFINAIAGFLISSLFLYLGKTYGFSWIFLVCSICSVTYGLIPIFYLPNTTGKDIEKFDELFKKK